MARKQATEAQKAAAVERRERIKGFARVVSGMTEAQRLALSARAGIVTIEGRALSPFNACLLLNQAETVSVVGGFQQWRRAGRVVRKGERGLALWIPTGGGAAEPSDAYGEDGADDSKRPAFILGTVFDVTQTDEITEGGE